MPKLTIFPAPTLFLIALLQLPLVAQETPKYEFFGGYSNVRPDTGLSRGSGQGAIVGATFYIRENWGISGDWSGSWFGTRSNAFSPTPESLIIGESQTNRQHFLVGPRYRLLNSRRISISVRAAVGAMRSSSEGFSDFRNGIDATPVRTDFEFADWQFLSSFGGSLDLKISDRLAWRVVQPEVLYWRSGGNQTDLRLSTGLVFRFGEK